MLNKLTTKTYFLCTYFLVSSIQFYAAFNHQLFGDEAFYWLEGQWLAWSYSEVPGWTPWTLSLMDWLLPKHQFFIRIPNLLAALSIPWLCILITRDLTAKKSNVWLSGLLSLSLPLLGVAGTLAIPDVWLIFFTLLAFWLLICAIDSGSKVDYLFLGLALALGINVHLRFWLIILLTSLVVFWYLGSRKQVVFKLLKFTLPSMIIGFIPVLLFNWQHEFPLLSFQLKDRHPWEFQASHLSFFLIQIVITTPWVFYLCLKNLKPGLSANHNHNNHSLTKVLTLTAVIHWLVYATVGFFSDTLRLNVHWTLVSYVMLMLITALNVDLSPRLKRWAMVTGISANLWLLFTLNFWLHHQHPQSQINTRITHHANGWLQLAEHTDELLIRRNSQNLLADHFMTLAQLKFYSNQIKDIKSLPHPLNIKHGRNKQLEIMGLLQSKSVDSQVLVVEHSALKLNEVIGFYQSTCELLNGLKLIDSLDINNGIKRYHYFETNTGDNTCDMPPIVYYEQTGNLLNGWVLHRQSSFIQATLYDSMKQTELEGEISFNTKPLGPDPLFEKLNSSHYQLLEFNAKMDSADTDSSIQLKLETPQHTIFSKRLSLNQ